MGQMAIVSWAPGFLQGGDCYGSHGPAAPMGALAILATVSLGSGQQHFLLYSHTQYGSEVT